jgi:hypothetical protein
MLSEEQLDYNGLPSFIRILGPFNNEAMHHFRSPSHASFVPAESAAICR